MGMASPLKDLRALTDDELIRRHDAAAQHTVVGTNHYLQELARRDQERQTRSTNRLNVVMTVLTFVTAVEAVVSIWDITTP